MGAWPTAKFQELLYSIVLVSADTWYVCLLFDVNIQEARLFLFFNSKHRDPLLVGKVDPVLVLLGITDWAWTLILLGSRTAFCHVSLEVGYLNTRVLRCHLRL
jgi:hypothetical protein